MTLALTSAAAAAAAFPPVVPVPAAEVAAFGGALRLLTHLERGERIDATALRGAMEAAFGASDATGAWTWKTAYDACEAATVLFLQKYGKALFRKAASPAARLSAITKITGLLPTHTRRSEESQALQQFSTPTPLGLAAVTAAAIADDLPGAVDQLGRLFGARKLLLEGGGIINGAFLRHRLIDEFSTLIHPAVDGVAGSPSIINYTGREGERPGVGQALRLIETETLEGGMVWLRHTVEDAAR